MKIKYDAIARYSCENVVKSTVNFIIIRIRRTDALVMNTL